MIGNGSSLPVTHMGNVHINTKSGPLVLSNVMHVLVMKKKLLAISQLTKDHDCIFEFTSKGFIVVSRPAGGNCLWFKTKWPLCFGAKPAFFSNRQVVAREEVWHKRLGHKC